MRSRISLILLVSGLAFTIDEPAAAATCYSTGNGNWNSAATWSCGHVPVGGDSVIVLAGDTVFMTQNHVYNGLPLQIQIYGVWYFAGGGSKITLPCGSHVEIMVGGLLQPNSNSGGHSETVRICNTTYWYYDQGPQSGYQIWPPYTLPVELVSFAARVLEGSVLLTWTTASEQNADRFDLHRSTDGSTWSLETSLPAQGNSQATVHYSWFDTPPADGLWYYRLVQVDRDGRSYEEGMVAAMVHSREGGIICMPNPVIEYHLMITSSETLMGAEVQLVDMAQRSGGRPRLIWEEERLLMLDLAGLHPGLYLAQVTTASRSHHCSFVIQ